MARSEWTSRTLPPLPEKASDELRQAREGAMFHLSRAERMEREAMVQRQEASRACEHLKALLEAVVTDPLFEVGGGE